MRHEKVSNMKQNVKFVKNLTWGNSLLALEFLCILVIFIIQLLIFPFGKHLKYLLHYFRYYRFCSVHIFFFF